MISLVFNVCVGAMLIIKPVNKRKLQTLKNTNVKPYETGTNFQLLLKSLYSVLKLVNLILNIGEKNNQKLKDIMIPLKSHIVLPMSPKNNYLNTKDSLHC